MAQTRLGEKRKREAGEQPGGAPQDKKRREEPAVSAAKVFDIPELREPIAEAFITDNLSETKSSLNNFRYISRNTYLTEQSILGLPELKNQVATLKKAIRDSVVRYGLNALESSSPRSTTADCILESFKDVGVRKDHLNEEETRRLVSLLHARPALYEIPMSFALIPRDEMPRATADLLDIKDIDVRSNATLLASAYAGDMTEESRRNVNNAIRSVRAATWRADTQVDGKPTRIEKSRDNARQATEAMKRFPVTSAHREAEHGNGRLSAGTGRLSNRTTLDEQARNEQARARVNASPAAEVLDAVSVYGRAITLPDIQQRLQNLVNATEVDDFDRCVIIAGMAREIEYISPRVELERIRNASGRRAMDERGAGQRSIAD